MIEYIEDGNGFGNIKAYDMYANGVRTFAWLCFYVSNKTWRLKCSQLGDTFPRRNTRAEAEADALAWWAAQQLEDMP